MRKPICRSAGGSRTAWTASRSCSSAARPSGRPDARVTARPTPPRRRHSKNQLAATLEAHHVRRVFALDEARFGLKVRHRRRWCPFGARPPWIHADRDEWLWLSVAVEPTTGESVVLAHRRDLLRALPAGAPCPR